MGYSEMKANDLVFQCNKCDHLLFVSKEKIEKLIDMDCPNCGEEADGLWTFCRMGDYDSEFGTKED